LLNAISILHNAHGSIVFVTKSPKTQWFILFLGRRTKITTQNGRRCSRWCEKRFDWSSKKGILY